MSDICRSMELVITAVIWALENVIYHRKAIRESKKLSHLPFSIVAYFFYVFQSLASSFRMWTHEFILGREDWQH